MSNERKVIVQVTRYNRYAYDSRQSAWKSVYRTSSKCDKVELDSSIKTDERKRETVRRKEKTENRGKTKKTKKRSGHRREKRKKKKSRRKQRIG